MKKVVIIQFVVLLIGTLFAWFNFFTEFLNWLEEKSCTTGCAVSLTNPFFAPCFFGAIFFTLALVLSIVIIKKIE